MGPQGGGVGLSAEDFEREPSRGAVAITGEYAVFDVVFPRGEVGEFDEEVGVVLGVDLGNAFGEVGAGCGFQVGVGEHLDAIEFLVEEFVEPEFDAGWGLGEFGGPCREGAGHAGVGESDRDDEDERKEDPGSAGSGFGREHAFEGWEGGAHTIRGGLLLAWSRGGSQSPGCLSWRW